MSNRLWCRIIYTGTLCCLLFCNVRGASIADWFNWGEKVNEDYSTRQIKDGVILPEVPFETLSSDERFLQEAQYFGLAPTSQLDSCQQGVILRLRASCSSLSEEQLAKLSVALLNCQSAAEGRPQYPCSDDMSLRECTGDMDPDTWNTYHLMNNRARAVCLSARQAQFRALTEMTVNKLMHTAQGQLEAMGSLQASQQKLGIMTEGTLKTVADGQKSLLFQQESLRSAQRNAHSFVSHSLKEIAREKSLVAAGHRELARLAQSIKQKLDGAEKDFQSQNADRQKQHKQLMSDLQIIQKQASEIWEDIDRSTNEILARHEIAIQHYEQTLESLRAINSSIAYLQNILENTRKEVDQRLGWIADTIGGAGGQLDLVIACLMHTGFLLMGMLTCAFIGAPMCTRVLLLALVGLNIIQLVLQGTEAAMSIPATIFVIAIGTGTHQLIYSLHRVFHIPPTASIAPPPGLRANGTVFPNKSETPFTKKLQNNIIKLWNQSKELIGFGVQSSDNDPRPSRANLNAPATSNDQSESEDEDDSGLEDLPARSQAFQNAYRRVETDRNSPSLTNRRSRSNTPRPNTPRQHCAAICLNGQPCRLPAAPQNAMCYRHSRQTPNTSR